MSYLEDGFSTTVTFGQLDSGEDLHVKEREVTPPGISMGGENDTTTMRNTAWRTKSPKQLKTLTPMQFTAIYDPDLFEDCLNIIGENGQVTVTFPDSETLVFYGWLDDITYDGIVEGEPGTCTLTVIPSNQNAGVETAPVFST